MKDKEIRKDVRAVLREIRAGGPFEPARRLLLRRAFLLLTEGLSKSYGFKAGTADVVVFEHQLTACYRAMNTDMLGIHLEILVDFQFHRIRYRTIESMHDWQDAGWDEYNTETLSAERFCTELDRRLSGRLLELQAYAEARKGGMAW